MGLGDGVRVLRFRHWTKTYATGRCSGLRVAPSWLDWSLRVLSRVMFLGIFWPAKTLPLLGVTVIFSPRRGLLPQWGSLS